MITDLNLGILNRVARGYFDSKGLCRLEERSRSQVIGTAINGVKTINQISQIMIVLTCFCNPSPRPPIGIAS